MADATSKRTKPAKSAAEQKFSESRTNVQWFAPVMREMRAAIVRFSAADGHARPKMAQEIAIRAKRSERIVARWIKGTDTPNGEALANLIKSDIGGVVIDALTGNVAHSWAKDLRVTRKVSKLRRAQAEIAEQLANLERGIE